MVGEETTKSPPQGAFWDAGQSPKRMDSGGEEEGEGGGGGQTGETDGREGDAKTLQGGEGGDGGEHIEDAYGGFQLG